MENQGGKSLRNHAETMETVWKKTTILGQKKTWNKDGTPR